MIPFLTPLSLIKNIEMNAMNLPIENEAKIREEISKRIRELRQLESS